MAYHQKLATAIDQLYLGIIASGLGFVPRPADVFCAKAKRQQ
ncbi:hypothetical protein ACQKMI_21860 [Lysinibacillus sp. NPDC097214]